MGVAERRSEPDAGSDKPTQYVGACLSSHPEVGAYHCRPTKPSIELLAQHLKISTAEYADFIHLAQPHLLVDFYAFSNGHSWQENDSQEQVSDSCHAIQGTGSWLISLNSNTALPPAEGLNGRGCQNS